MNKDDLTVYLLFFVFTTIPILILYLQAMGYLPNNFAEVYMEGYFPLRRYGL